MYTDVAIENNWDSQNTCSTLWHTWYPIGFYLSCLPWHLTSRGYCQMGSQSNCETLPGHWNILMDGWESHEHVSYSKYKQGCIWDEHLGLWVFSWNWVVHLPSTYNRNWSRHWWAKSHLTLCYRCCFITNILFSFKTTKPIPCNNKQTGTIPVSLWPCSCHTTQICTVSCWIILLKGMKLLQT